MSKVTDTDRCEHCGAPTGLDGGGGEHAYRIASYDPAKGSFQAIASRKFQRPSRESGGKPGRRNMYVCSEEHGRQVCPAGHFIVWLDEVDMAPMVAWDSTGTRLEPFWGTKTPKQS
jgi:hypothetical protein